MIKIVIFILPPAKYQPLLRIKCQPLKIYYLIINNTKNKIKTRKFSKLNEIFYKFKFNFFCYHYSCNIK